MSPDQEPRSGAENGGSDPSLLTGAGHLAALWALAFAQPLFDLLGRNPDFFVARGDTGGDIVVFALVFVLVPPLLMLAAEAVAWRVDPRARRALHVGLVGLLAVALALQIIKELMTRPAGVMLALALLAGAGVAWLYVHERFTRALLDVLIVAPVVVLAIFLLFSEASRLVLPQEEAKAADVSIPTRAPVVFVVFDELPLGSLLTTEGSIDAARFPNFAELARHATWYRGATAAADSTPMAVPALLSGRTPDPDQLPAATDQPHNLFTLLGGTYRMRVNEEATRLCPEDLCPDEEREGAGDRLGSLFSDLRVVSEHLLLPNALREGLPDVDQTFGGFATEVGSVEAPRFAVNDRLQLSTALSGDESDEERFVSFLHGIDGRDGMLDFLHLEVPHYPWVHFPDGRRYSELESEFKPFFDDAGRFQAPLYVTNAALQRHLLETGYADTLLGAVIEKLRRVGAWRRAMVVVVSDHGAAFIPGEFRRAATPGNLGQLSPVPLFVKEPGRVRGSVVDRHFCLTALLPLIARRLGAEYPWEPEACSPRRVRQSRIGNEELGEGFTTASFARVRRELRRFVARIDRLFGSGGWAPLYALGSARGLVGTPAAAARLAGGGGPARFEDADRFGSGPTPETLLRGEASGVEPGTPLAVAVNGRFAASDVAFEADGAARFSILFPPRALRHGPNVVELYAVRRAGPDPVVTLLGSA